MNSMRNLAPARIAVVLAAAAFARSHGAFAQTRVLDRFRLHVEGGVDAFVAGEQTQRFGLGGNVAGRLGVQIVGPLSAQLSVASYWFTARNNGDTGRLTAFELGLRLAPRVSDGFVGGPVLDANAGFDVTGDLDRFGFDVALGWEFVPTPMIAFGPMVRYVYVLQPDNEPQPDDAQFLTVGLGLTLRVPPASHEASDARAANAPPPPPADSDNDGIPDARDACPRQPEDVDRVQDDDGCPETDADNDGIADAADHCPERAETINGFGDDDGCPDEAPPPPPTPAPAPAPAPSEPTEEIGQRILFDYGSSHLHSDARDTIARLCDELRAHPEVLRVRAVGHADERGNAGANQVLSATRSATAARALVRCGIAPERIESMGVGATDPVCAGHDEECRQRNRRVVFVVVERGH